MDTKSRVAQMDGMVSRGEIVNAVKQFFSDSADTSDYNDLKTSGKNAMVEKMEGFTGSIAKVNEITHHHSITEGNISASEFTFDFDMKDGSHIHWHEIIRRKWDDNGHVVEEQYFNADA